MAAGSVKHAETPQQNLKMDTSLLHELRQRKQVGGEGAMRSPLGTTWMCALIHAGLIDPSGRFARAEKPQGCPAARERPSH